MDSKKFARGNLSASLRAWIALLLLFACLLPWEPAAAQDSATPTPLVTLITATPHENGAIIHVVGYGQTLWAIAQAYHIPVDQIRVWNSIAADSNDIYVGQQLLVRPAGVGSSTFTPQPRLTLSEAENGAPTLSPTPAPTRPRMLPTAQSTLTPTPAAALALSQQKIPFWTIAVLMAGCVLLVVLLVTRKK